LSGLQIWLRQPSTITGLGILGGAIAGALSNLVTGNATIDTIAAILVLVLTHLGVDDHSAVAQAAGRVEADAARAIASGQPAASIPMAADDLAALVKASVAEAMATPAATPTPTPEGKS
jgi:hypothetical protein